MSATVGYASDAAILGEVFLPDRPTLARQHAEWLLTLEFNARQKSRIIELGEKANRGELKPSEQEELDRFIRVGMMLNLLKAKAELSLRQTTPVQAPSLAVPKDGEAWLLALLQNAR